jgi:hypothetical protein
VGERIIEEVLKDVNGGEMPVGWNDTNSVLIPKVKTPNHLKIFAQLVYVMLFTRL